MQNKKIIICKYFLKRKCKFGEDCRFEHIGTSKIAQIFEQLNYLIDENMSLKTELNKLRHEVQKSEKKTHSMKESGVHASKKRFFSSLFKTETANENSETTSNLVKAVKKLSTTEVPRCCSSKIKIGKLCSGSSKNKTN